MSCAAAASGRKTSVKNSSPDLECIPAAGIMFSKEASLRLPLVFDVRLPVTIGWLNNYGFSSAAYGGLVCTFLSEDFGIRGGFSVIYPLKWNAISSVYAGTGLQCTVMSPFTLQWHVGIRAWKNLDLRYTGGWNTNGYFQDMITAGYVWKLKGSR
jgi:hypothetical protein